jgi:hypothetical protein
MEQAEFAKFCDQDSRLMEDAIKDIGRVHG